MTDDLTAADRAPLDAASRPPRTPIPARILYATYAVGLSSNALVLMLKVLVPLWALHLAVSSGA